MSKLPVKNWAGESVGEFEIDDALLVFDRGQQALHEAVVAYQANQRAGTASTLSKSFVAGARSKPWKQKGTGRARSGYKQSPIWRGGAVAFGPHPRSFAKKLTQKSARLAFRRALSDKISAGQVVVVEAFEVTAPKTREMAAYLKKVEAERGAVIVLDQAQDTVKLASRNLPNVKVTTAQHLNVYDVLRYPVVLVSKAGMAVLTERLQAGSTS